MEILKSEKNLCSILLSPLEGKLPAFLQMLEQLASLDEIEGHVKSLCVLECILQINYEWVSHSSQNSEKHKQKITLPSFGQDIRLLSMLNHILLLHGLNRIYLTVFL